MHRFIVYCIMKEEEALESNNMNILLLMTTWYITAGTNASKEVLFKFLMFCLCYVHIERFMQE